VREVFTGDATKLHAGKGNMVLQAFLGRHSLLLLEEERHLGERRMLLPAFHGTRIAEHTELMHQLAARRINAWEPGQPLDVQQVMQELTLEVILRVVFGLAEGAALHELQRATAGLPERSQVQSGASSASSSRTWASPSRGGRFGTSFIKCASCWMPRWRGGGPPWSGRARARNRATCWG
jgi:cytochrome P450